MTTVLELVRRYVEDWLNTGNTAVCHQILDPDYTLYIGEHVIAGREAYIEATTAGLLEPWPDVQVIAHQVLWSGNRAAVRLTEHGHSARNGQGAAWGVLALFESDGQRLVRGWAQEDYDGRRRQLQTGIPDPIEVPAEQPWSTPACDGDLGSPAEMFSALRRSS
ncbi:MAG: nuclear transport factor 2 family protein [Sporichthyaceae bacterium]